MKTDDGFIIEATPTELYSIYINEEYFKLMSFAQFLENCRNQGTKIIDESEGKKS